MNQKLAYGMAMVVVATLVAPGAMAAGTDVSSADDVDQRLACRPFGIPIVDDVWLWACATVQTTCDNVFRLLSRPCPFQ